MASPTVATAICPAKYPPQIGNKGGAKQWVGCRRGKLKRPAELEHETQGSNRRLVDPTKLHLSRRYRVGYRSVPLGLRALSVQYAHQTPLYKNLGSCTSKAGEASGRKFPQYESESLSFHAVCQRSSCCPLCLPFALSLNRCFLYLCFSGSWLFRFLVSWLLSVSLLPCFLESLLP